MNSFETDNGVNTGEKRQRRKEIQVIVLREWKQKLTIIVNRQYSLGVIQAHR